MKKIILMIIVMMMAGCSNVTDVIMPDKLEELGYSKEVIRLIDDYNIRDNILKYEYDDDLFGLLSDPSFNSSDIDLYMKLIGLDVDDRLMIVNKEYYINDNEYNEDVLNLMKTDYYIHLRCERYLAKLNEGYDYREAIEIVNANRDYEPYTHTIDSDLSDDILMIANKYYTLNDYVPDDLVEIDGNYGIEGYLREEAYNAYLNMADDAAMDGESLWITSPYRSYNSQTRIYNSYLENDPQYIVDTYSSRPGFSDHQTGLTVDIIAPGYDFDSFEYSSEFEWLNENAHKYGFILRYPDNKEEITGYTYESWHYRYVGENVAKYIHDTGITFDEYYTYFISGEN